MWIRLVFACVYIFPYYVEPVFLSSAMVGGICERKGGFSYTVPYSPISNSLAEINRGVLFDSPQYVFVMLMSTSQLLLLSFHYSLLFLLRHHLGPFPSLRPQPASHDRAPTPYFNYYSLPYMCVQVCWGTGTRRV